MYYATMVRVNISYQITVTFSSSLLLFSLQPITSSVVFAINEEYTEIGDLQLTLQDGDEVAIIPPISGG